MNRRPLHLFKLGAALSLGLLSLVGAACDGGNNSDTDGPAPDRDGGPDGSVDPASIIVEFVYLDAAGDPVSGDQPIVFPNFTIDELTLQLHKVRVVGDVALPDDLLQDSLVLEYPWNNRARASYASARPGIYSRIDYHVERSYDDEELPPGFGGEPLSIRVRGEATIDGEQRRFEYADDRSVHVELKFWKRVWANQPGTIQVGLDLQGWFDVVAWDDLGPGGSGGGPDAGGPDGGGPGADAGDDDGADDDQGEDDDDQGAGDDGDDDGGSDEVVFEERVAREMRKRLKTAFQIVEEVD